MNDALRLASKDGLPLLTKAWERFFPVVERNMERLEKYFKGGGRNEILGWMENLPGIADNLVRAAGSAGRLMGGIVRGFAPLARMGSGSLARWFGEKADWANSERGMARMRQIGQQALPIFRGLANVGKALGDGLLKMLGGNSGRSAAYILDHLASVSIPAFVGYVERAALYTPQFVETLSDLTHAAGVLFGPHGGFMVGLTVLSNFARIVADLTTALGPLGQGLSAVAGAAFLLNKATGGMAMSSLASAAGMAGGAGKGGGMGAKGTYQFARAHGSGILASGLAGMSQARMATAMVGGMGMMAAPSMGSKGGAAAMGAFGGAMALAPLGFAAGPAAPFAVPALALAGAIGGGIFGSRSHQQQDRMARSSYGLGAHRVIGSFGDESTGVYSVGERRAAHMPGLQWNSPMSHMSRSEKKAALQAEVALTATTKERRSTLADMIRHYHRLSGIIGRSKKGEQEWTAAVSERHGLMRQMAETSPVHARIDWNTGRVRGINVGGMERYAAGLPGTGRPTQAELLDRAQLLGRSGSRAQSRERGLFRRLSRAMPDRDLGNLQTAFGSGDEAQIETALRQLMRGRGGRRAVPAVERFMAGWGGETSLELAGMQRNVTALLHPANRRRLNADQRERREEQREARERRQRIADRRHDREMERRRREEPSGMKDESRTGAAVGRGAERAGDDRRARGVRSDSDQRASEQKAWRQGRRVADKFTDGVKDRRSLQGADKAAEDVMRKAIKTWDEAAWKGRAKNRGADITKSFAQGMRRAVGEASKAAQAIVSSAVRAFDGAVADADTGADHDTAAPRKRTPRRNDGGNPARGDAPSPQAGKGAHRAGYLLGKRLARKAVNSVGGDISPGGGWGGSEGVVEGFIPLAARLGIPVGSTKRATRNTASGGISDHWIGNKNAYAIDFPVAGERGDQLAAMIGKKLGTDWAGGSWLNVNRNGYRVQVGWKVPGHYDHVHVGASKQGDAPNKPPLRTKMSVDRGGAGTGGVQLVFTGDINVRNKAEYDEFVARLRRDLEGAFRNDASHSAEMTGA
jgi:hypothetical protein